MKVVILCGGRGTRLQEETEWRPKPLIDVGGRPILWHIMKRYAHYGFTDFLLCLGYKGDMLKQYFLNYQAMRSDFTVRLGALKGVEYHGNHLEAGWTVTLAETGPTAMTGARIKRIERYLADEPEFMLTYGDGVADIDLAKAAAFHRRHGKIGTVTGVRPPSRFGELLTDREQVMEFSEKPQASQAFINGGFFIFNRRFLDYLSADDGCILEGEPLEALARDGQLMMYRHEGFWQCMDTARDLRLLEQLWNSGQAPWKSWG